jgi:hypothetical protein
MKTEKWVNTPNASENNNKPSQANEVKKGQEACCGRSYNEQSDFSQVNFAAYQSILDKRNELLGSVKAHRLP